MTRDINREIREKLDRRRRPERYRPEPVVEDSGPVLPTGSADAGKGEGGDTDPSMNDLIRRGAGLTGRFGK